MPASDDLKSSGPAPDYVAPDGSEISLLVEGGKGSLAIAVLRAGRTAVPTKHRSVEELWYVLAGECEIVRGARQDRARRGDSFRIPPGTPFQWRARGTEDLVLLIATVPPWPGPHEAEPATGPWTPSEL